MATTENEQFEIGPDYLALAPYCWGRAKTARKAFEAVKREYFLDRPDEHKASLWRLPDDVDTVTFDGMGGFSYTLPNGRIEQPKKIGSYPISTDPSEIPESVEREVPETN